MKATFCTFVLLALGVRGEQEWWKSMSLYQIYPRSFMDSDGNGIGDFQGIQSKLQHLVDSKFDALWLSPIYTSPMVDFGYDISDFLDIDPVYGTMEEFENLLEAAHDLSLKVILDFVPNHSSDKHEWFEKSAKKIEPYTDYYVWHEGKIVNGVRQPPNNWNSVFYGSAWTWNNDRQAYYLHQFAREQPDLNFRNEKVVEEVKNILRFWLDKGVDGFRIDAIPHLFEVDDLRDEPLSGKTSDPKHPDYTQNVYTRHLDETYDMVSQWRKVLDEYEATGNPRIMMVEAWANISKTMEYYEHGVHFPFNFGLITSVDRHSSAKNFKGLVDNWMQNLPDGAVSNWVTGNHDTHRLVTRFGAELAPAVTIMAQLLPGVAVTYYGEEIGMEDTWMSWEETQDPAGCNVGANHYEESSRDPERTPFQWDNTTSAGFSSNPKTWLRINDNYKTVNLNSEKAVDESYYKSFIKVTDLRKWPAIREGSLETSLLTKDVFAFSRELQDEKSVYIAVNVDNQPQVVNLKMFKNIPSEVQLYHSTSETNVKIGDIVDSESVQIPGRGASIFTSVDSSIKAE